MTWNPLSIRESTYLQSTLQSVASFFSTVTDELRTLYASVTQRIHGAIQSGLYCEVNLVSSHTNDIQTDAQELIELYISRGIRVGY